MKKILIATHNLNKFSDLKNILNRLNFKVKSLEDFDIKQKVEENGKNFSENSLIKAKFYANISGMLTIADDGGIKIPIINWESNKEFNNQESLKQILTKLKSFKGDDRKVCLITILTVFNPQTNDYFQGEGKIEGQMAEYPNNDSKIASNFSFGDVFYVPIVGKMLNDFNKQEKEKFNHRLLAVEKIKEKLIIL